MKTDSLLGGAFLDNDENNMYYSKTVTERTQKIKCEKRI